MCRFEDVADAGTVLRVPDSALEGTCEVDVELVVSDARWAGADGGSGGGGADH